MLYLVQHYAEAAFAADPGRTAVVCPERGDISFGELEMQSNRLANHLRELGVTRQDRIAVCHRRTADYVIALLGILKADAVYVPVPDTSPPERAGLILNDCRPKVVVCDRAHLHQIQIALGKTKVMPQVVVLDAPSHTTLADRQTRSRSESDWLTKSSVHRPSCRNIDTDLAYILYTSGSTGKPKGVMISHLNILNYIEWADDYFSITAEDRILGTAPFHFDMATFDLYAAQKAGAALCIASEEEILFPALLANRIDTERISVWKAVSSLLTYLVTAGVVSANRFQSLRQVIFSGEALPTRHLIEWMRMHPRCTFYNGYGPTETTGVSACHRIEEVPQGPDDVVPIGRACGNSEIFVLRDDDTLAEVEERGELCIRGSCVSAGYWNALEATTRAFVRNPLRGDKVETIYRSGDIGYTDEDGLLYLVGRTDEQVKHHGYRIELGEIVHAVRSLPHVRDAVVLLLQRSDADQPELVAFLESSPATNHATVRSALRSLLPDHMIPRRYIDLKRLPRTDRGKLDRGALERIYTDQKSGEDNQGQSA